MGGKVILLRDRELGSAAFQYRILKIRERSLTPVLVHKDVGVNKAISPS